MRRSIAGALLVLLTVQSPVAAAAGTPSRWGDFPDVAALIAPLRLLVASIGTASVAHPRISHTPLPQRPVPNYADRRRYTRLVPKPVTVAIVEHAARPIDLVKLVRERHNEGHIIQRETAAPRSGKLGVHRGVFGLSAAAVTGIRPWWTYEARSIPGVGQAMVNVANRNFLFEENDVDIPAGGLDLAFRRMYNSQSQHDAGNDDNTTPSVYGNRWTNNLDVHLGWDGSSTVSVYTADGSRDDYTCTIGQLGLCTSTTAGVYDLLSIVQGSGGPCQFQWTKKSGTSYIFDAPYACGNNGSNRAGYFGRLLAIYGRNTNFSIQLSYSWNPDPSNPENIAQIVATHNPDNDQLTLTFGKVSGSNPVITELMSVIRPDGSPNNETINYHYTSTGELQDVDKPGNQTVLFNNESLPNNFLDGAPIATGNIPETYVTQPGAGLIEVCGPRAAISIIYTNQHPDDGACVDFDYNNHQLTDWYTRGVLDPTPEDNVLSPSPIQTPGGGVSTGFVQWNDTMFVTLVNCSGSGNNGTSLSDQYGHQTLSCYDSNSRVTQTQGYTGASWLTTYQTWDSNNNLTSTTDARGYTTNMGYDTNGNTVEVSLPQQSTTDKGTITPTSFYDYDQYNNILRYCDASNNSHNTFTQPTDSLCQTYGTHYAQYNYNTTDPNELYGCLTDTYTPLGYHTLITYGGACGTGQPTQAQASAAFSQDDPSDPSRRPKQTFTYNSNGTLSTYDAGNGAWQINYTPNGLNQVASRTDPDGVTSFSCYNLDGSTFYSETAYQNQLDNQPSCPTIANLKNGATPPTYAVSYGYDADGDVVTELRHHNCTTGSGNCTAKNNASTSCYNLTVAAGTTCKFYDGLDRAVEVKQPYDSTFDLYTKPWITRYLYDLTGGQYTFHNQTFLAYGNLYLTEELLPQSGGNVTLTWAAGGPTSLASNTVYQGLKATGFDALDRPTVKVSLVAGSNAEQVNTETLTWDTSPLDNNGVAGFLGKDCNAVSQCQQFDYMPDGQEATFNSNDGTSPKRTYSYDADGRATSILSAAYPNAQQYSYDPNGRLTTSIDAGGVVGVSSPATLTHNYYPDGTLESIDVLSSALTQSKLFSYSYRKDGRKEWEQLDDTALQGNYQGSYGKTQLTYTYTPGGRLTDRDESGVGHNQNATQFSYYLQPGNVTGLEQSETTPALSLSSMSYSAESELMSLIEGGTTVGYTYTLRGEHACSATNCTPSQTLRLGQMFGNGLSIHAPVITQGAYQSNWDDRMAVQTLMNQTSGCSSYCPSSSWSYDQAGRLTTEQGQQGTQTTEGTVTRCYDAENHLVGTDGTCNSPYEAISWGPNGHPLTIGAPGSNETLHWDGNQMLFATRKSNGQDTIDDIKIEAQGDVLPQDAGYQGLTFFDRGPGGAVMGCHNANSQVSNGLTDVWIRGWQLSAQDSTPCYQSSGGMPTSIDWYGTPLTSGTGLGLPIGQGGVLGMPRTDGLTDNYDTIQGVRAYSSTAGTWTTPDAYAGVVHDPKSQKSYMWNGNDPVNYSDPTGYSDVPTYNFFTPAQPDTGPPQCSDCDVVAYNRGGDDTLPTVIQYFSLVGLQAAGLAVRAAITDGSVNSSNLSKALEELISSGIEDLRSNQFYAGIKEKDFTATIYEVSNGAVARTKDVSMAVTGIATSLTVSESVFSAGAWRPMPNKLVQWAFGANGGTVVQTELSPGRYSAATGLSIGARIRMTLFGKTQFCVDCIP